MIKRKLNFNYLYITNDSEIASYVEKCGISRIFIDLESIGKKERQGHLDTFISKHDFSDISPVKGSLKHAELLVRLNPYHENSKMEVDKAIQLGADIVMLPMIQNIEHVIRFGSYIGGRAKFIPLIETCYSAENIRNIEELPFVDELHIGLNDLHLELECKFMFELIANGYVENLVADLKKPYGIGGIARVGDGKVPGEMIMAQHVRLGSSAVILSRSFYFGNSTVDELKENVDVKTEVSNLERFREEFTGLSDSAHRKKFQEFRSAVSEIVRGSE